MQALQGGKSLQYSGASVQRSVTCAKLQPLSFNIQHTPTCAAQKIKVFTFNYSQTIREEKTVSRKYKFYDSKKPHFVSFAIVKWIDLFTRNDYVDIVTESLSYCIQKK